MLRAGWKSNVSQQQMKAEFIEDIERADNRLSTWETQKGKEGVSPIFGVWGFYWRWWSCACVLSVIQEVVKTKTRVQVSFLGARESWR